MPPLDPTPFTLGGAVHGAWTYPLFDAILQRRARRFPLGASMPGQGQAFVSPHVPLSLDPVEEALLMLAGTGVSGIRMLGTGSPLIVLGGTSAPGLGFRFVRPPAGSKNVLPNPVGLDGVFEAYCPPYYPSMDAAVDAVVAAKWGPGGICTGDGGPVSFHQRQVPQDEVPVSPDEVVQMTKDLCNYIYATYGRFPAQLDAMNMCMWLQAHHLETDYDDHFMQPGAYHHAIAHHMQVWHGRRP